MRPNRPTVLQKSFVVEWGWGCLFKYLGVPLHYDKLKRGDIHLVVDKIINRTPGWKSQTYAYGARLILLKVWLPSIPNYLMAVFKFPKWAIEAINSQIAKKRIDRDGNHKYHISNCQSLTQKEYEGVGIPDLRDLNMCLLTSWVHRYRDADSKLWKAIIYSTYQIWSPNIFCCNDRNSFPSRKGLCELLRQPKWAIN
jgi:hypothetical protein